MSAFAWTSDQLRAILEVGRSIVVSAAAGAGKTAVLAERCVYLVCDAPPPHRCSIDQLLVLTFTEAAAAEMKGRIRAKFMARLAEAPRDVYLRDQIALLETAHISTIHAFCLTLVRRWFDRLDLDPAAAVLAEDQARILKIETVDRLFDSLYMRPDDLAARFRDWVDVYGLGNDSSLRRFLLRLSDYADSLPDPQAWLRAGCDRLAQGRDRLNHFLLTPLAAELALHVTSLEQCSSWASADNPRVAAYGRVLVEHAAKLRQWHQSLSATIQIADAAPFDEAQAAERFDRLRGEILEHELAIVRIGRTHTESSQDSLGDSAKKTREAFKKRFDARIRKRFALFTAAEGLELLDRIAPYAQTLVDLTVAFRADYAECKRRQAAIDFADFERFALRLLDDANVATELRRRFAHILVDEYQDINPLQDSLLRQISREDDADAAANLFVVGDAKQSIYAFRATEPRVFQDRLKLCDLRAHRYTSIHLQHNFRSRPRILDSINLLFSRLMNESMGGISYDYDAQLRSGQSDSADDGPCTVEVHLLDNAARGETEDADDNTEESEFVDPGDPAEWESCEREAFVIAREIKRMLAAEPSLKLTDFAILLRAPAYRAELMALVLQRSGIPALSLTARTLLDTSEIRDVRALLEVIDNPRQDIPLAAVMRSSILGDPFAEDELLTIRGADHSRPFHETVLTASLANGQTDTGRRLRRLLDRIDGYRQALRDRQFADVLWEMIERTGYLMYIMGLPGGDEKRRNLMRFHETAHQFSGFRRQGLRRFLQYVESLEAADRDMGVPSRLSPTANAVQIMSIHAAKGLEFAVVFVADLGRRFNLSDKSGRMILDRRSGIGLRVVDPVRMIEYASPAHSLAAAGIDVTLRAEELRLLYVAMTRAKDKLVLVGNTALNSASGMSAADRDCTSLTPLDIQTAMRPLDWIIPALATMPRDLVTWPGAEAGSALFHVHTYDARVMRDWRIESITRPAISSTQRSAADLAPLPSDEPTSTDRTAAEEVIERVKFNYPHLALTSVRAVVAASDVKGVYDLLNEPNDAPILKPWDDRFTSPNASSRLGREQAALRGAAIHKALQHIDFALAGDAAAVAVELNRLRETGLLTSREHELVDRDMIAWFARTPLADAIRQAGNEYRREFMFVAAQPATLFDPTLGAEAGERVLVRGVADGVLPRAGAIEIVDFKTDDITAESVPDRVKRYESQMKLYAASIAPIFKMPVRCAWLVFLSPRMIVPISNGTHASPVN